jgi:hypothetical protein
MIDEGNPWRTFMDLMGIPWDNDGDIAFWNGS